jgi:drug/metabolite transporter (DMT)-like permease
MPEQALGHLFAIATALLWACSAVCFEAAGRRVGSLVVNLLRLSIAAVLLGGLCYLRRGLVWPGDASGHTWAWLLVSGGLGFFVCDLCLFRAYVLIGARRSTLVLALAPVFAAVLDAFVLRRSPTLLQGVGMAVTLIGVVWVIAERPNDEAVHTARERRIGIVLALVAAVMQPLGAASAAVGMTLPGGGQFDPMAATFIRVLAGVAGFVVLVPLSGRTRDVIAGVRDARAMTLLGLGALAGPVLGVTLFLASLQRLPSGVTQTILATIPVLLLPVAMFQKHERVTWRAAAGAMVAVGGVVILCLT